MSFVQRWSNSVGWATSNTVTVSGATANNLLIGSCSVAKDVTGDAAWTEITTGEPSKRKLFWRIATGDSDDNITITHSSAQFSRLTVLEISGVDTADPIEAVVSGIYSRFSGFGIGLDDHQPFSQVAVDAGFSVAFLCFESASTLSNYFDPSIGDEYTYGSNHCAVLPDHAASDTISFSWDVAGSGSDTVVPNSAFLVLLKSAAGGGFQSAWARGSNQILGGFNP